MKIGFIRKSLLTLQKFWNCRN